MSKKKEEVKKEEAEKAPEISLKEKEMEVDAILDELEGRVLSGGTDQMNATKNEILSVRIKIKRLL